MTLLETALNLSTLRPHHLRTVTQNILLFAREYVRQSAKATQVIPTNFTNLTLTERRFWMIIILTGAAAGFFGFLRLISLLTLPDIAQ